MVETGIHLENGVAENVNNSTQEKGDSGEIHGDSRLPTHTPRSTQPQPAFPLGRDPGHFAGALCSQVKAMQEEQRVAREERYTVAAATLPLMPPRGRDGMREANREHKPCVPF